jgi:hypothetical protein
MQRTVSLLLLGAALLAPGAALAAPTSEVLYRVTQVRNSVWRYDYTLVNHATNPQNSAITLFETYFPYGSAQNIGASLAKAARGWQASVTTTAGPIVGASGPIGGGYTATALRPGKYLRPGNSLSGFSVEFEWLGPNPPGVQDYLAIHDFDTQDPAVNDGMRVWGDQGRNELAQGKGRNRPRLGGPTPHLSYYEHGRTRLDPSVPEPTTLALAGSGIVGLVAARLRRRKSAAR